MNSLTLFDCSSLALSASLTSGLAQACARALAAALKYGQSSTSLPGGNQVDGLPPVCSWWHRLSKFTFSIKFEHSIVPDLILANRFSIFLGLDKRRASGHGDHPNTCVSMKNLRILGAWENDWNYIIHFQYTMSHDVKTIWYDMIHGTMYWL